MHLYDRRATVTNNTVQEDNSTLTYSVTWGSNKSGNFSGGGSSFTNGDGASVSLKFHGMPSIRQVNIFLPVLINEYFRFNHLGIWRQEK